MNKEYNNWAPITIKKKVQYSDIDEDLLEWFLVDCDARDLEDLNL